MARVKVTSIVSDIRGKVKGSIFQGSQGGLILKSNTNRVVQQTLAENAAQLALQKAHCQWQNLTVKQRAIWDSFVQYNPIAQKHNDGLIISGHQAFLKANAYRHRYGLATLILPQFIKCDIDAVTMTTESDGATLTITTNRVIDVAKEFLYISLTSVKPPSRTTPGNTYKLVVFPTVVGPTIDITAEYIDIFGAVPGDTDTYFLKYTNISLFSGLAFPFKTFREN